MSDSDGTLRCLRGDWRAAARQRRLAVGFAGLVFTYDWVLNQGLVGALAGSVLGTHPSARSTLLAGVAATIWVLVEQASAGACMYRGVSAFPRTVARTHARWRSKVGEDVRAFGDMSLPTKLMVAFAMGTTVVAIGNSIAGSTRTKRDLALSTLLCGLVTFGVVGGVGVVGMAVERTPAEPIVHPALWALGTWWMWLAAVLAVFAVHLARTTQARAPVRHRRARRTS